MDLYQGRNRDNIDVVLRPDAELVDTNESGISQLDENEVDPTFNKDLDSTIQDNDITNQDKSRYFKNYDESRHASSPKFSTGQPSLFSGS